MREFLRLLRYAKPYRGRLAAAFAAMLAYGAASAVLAYLVKPILDNVLVEQNRVAQVTIAIIVVYLVKGRDVRHLDVDDVEREAAS